MSGSEDNLFSRWSRRKAEVAKEDAVEIDHRPPEEADGELDGLSDEEVLEKLELPDPESLKEGDDFSAFMASTVPDHLRKRALRVLWKSNPTLANLDGLLEYGDDFTDAAMVPEVLNTAYKVGRGFLKDIVEDEEGDELAAEVAEEEENSEPETEAEIEIATLDEEDVPATPAPTDAEPEPYIPRPRMQFTKT